MRVKLNKATVYKNLLPLYGKHNANSDSIVLYPFIYLFI